MLLVHLTASVAQVAMDISDPNSLTGFVNSKIAEVVTLLGSAGTAIAVGYFLRHLVKTGFAIAGAIIAAVVAMFVLYMIKSGMDDGRDLIDREVNGQAPIIQPAPASKAASTTAPAAGSAGARQITIRL